MLSLDDLRSIVADVAFPTKDFYVGELATGYYLQVQYDETCVDTGQLQRQHGRKWYISPHSTKSEVVQTCLKALLTSAEHQVREHFTYRGKRVFGPHFDVDVLWEACGQRLDVRS